MYPPIATPAVAPAASSTFLVSIWAPSAGASAILGDGGAGAGVGIGRVAQLQASAGSPGPQLFVFHSLSLLRRLACLFWNCSRWPATDIVPVAGRLSGFRTRASA